MEGGEAFGAVARFEALDLALDFFVEGLFEFSAMVGEEALLDAFHGDGRGDGEARGHFGGFGGEVFRSDEVIVDAESMGFSSIDHIGGVEEFGGAGGSDEAGEKESAAKIGIEAEFGEGFAEGSGGGGDAEIAGESKISAAAGSGTIDGAEDGFGKIGDGHADFFTGADEGFEFVMGFAGAGIAEKRNVAARAEAAASASDDDDVGTGVFAGVEESGGEGFA